VAVHPHGPVRVQPICGAHRRSARVPPGRCRAGRRQVRV